MVRAIGADIGQRIGLHPHAGIDGRFEQVGVERHHLALQARGPFREQRHALALLQHIDQSLEHVTQFAPVAARDEHGAGAGGQATHHGPGADLGLGHEPAGTERVDDKDVEPRDVVGHHQRVREWGHVAIAGNAHAAQAQQPAGPAARDLRAYLGRGEWKHQRAGRQSLAQMDGDAREAPG